jgi:hypothetical protein
MYVQNWFRIPSLLSLCVDKYSNLKSDGGSITAAAGLYVQDQDSLSGQRAEQLKANEHSTIDSLSLGRRFRNMLEVRLSEADYTRSPTRSPSIQPRASVSNFDLGLSHPSAEKSKSDSPKTRLCNCKYNSSRRRPY